MMDWSEKSVEGVTVNEAAFDDELSDEALDRAVGQFSGPHLSKSCK